MFFMDSDGNNQISLTEFKDYWEKEGGKHKKSHEAGSIDLNAVTEVRRAENVCFLVGNALSLIRVE